MKKTISLIYLVLLVSLVALGQQDPQFTNHMFYKLGSNPGYAGSEGAVSGTILNRHQWVGFDGSPKTLVFSVDAPVKVFGNTGGLGLNIVQDSWGFYENLWLNLNYSYKVTTSIGTLGIGISPGLFNYQINPKNGWRTNQYVINNTIGASGDNRIPQKEASQITLDIGLGAYLYTNKYYAGFSISHINEGEVKYDDLATDHLVRHFYLTGGYNIKLSDPLFEVRPSVLFKTDLASWQLDLNTNIVYNDKYWGGISYRYQDAVALLMGMELVNGLRIGYSFDLTTSAIKRNAFGSHEFFVNYAINLERNRMQKYKSIRFL